MSLSRWPMWEHLQGGYSPAERATLTLMSVTMYLLTLTFVFMLAVISRGIVFLVLAVILIAWWLLKKYFERKEA